MTSGEQLYLTLVTAGFVGFGVWLAMNSLRYTRLRGGKPEAIPYEAQQGAAHGD